MSKQQMYKSSDSVSAFQFCKMAAVLSMGLLCAGALQAAPITPQAQSSSSAVQSPQELERRLGSLPNPTVKAAMKAYQAGDRRAWEALFTSDATMTDDGNPRDSKGYTNEALGHERMTAIQRIENNGLDLVVDIHTERWGDFRSYFRFHVTANGKISRLDIGRTN